MSAYWTADRGADKPYESAIWAADGGAELVASYNTNANPRPYGTCPNGRFYPNTNSSAGSCEEGQKTVEAAVRI